MKIKYLILIAIVAYAISPTFSMSAQEDIMLYNNEISAYIATPDNGNTAPRVGHIIIPIVNTGIAKISTSEIQQMKCKHLKNNCLLDASQLLHHSAKRYIHESLSLTDHHLTLNKLKRLNI